MKILVLNSGSSSIKYKLIDMQGEICLADGLVQRIADPASSITHRCHTAESSPVETRIERAITDHAQGIQIAVELLTAQETGVIETQGEITAIGHRVVHGGEFFRESRQIDEAVIDGIKACIPLAPLHNPGCLAGIETAMTSFPTTRQVAVFDTAYHQSIPPHAYHYALPYSYYEELGIRRYGFHGTSHCYVSKETARLLDKPLERTNLISLHLGNGASITAVANGRSVDTSMGMTPLAGVIMGTRCGDIDPAIIDYIADRKNLTLSAIMDLLARDSGLKGICGRNDLRDIHQGCAAGDKHARLALKMLVHRYRHYVGAYMTVLGRVDAIVFTAGIGENDATVRHGVCEAMDHLGILIDPELNRNWNGTAGVISTGASPVKILVIPTNEELEIARQTAAVISADGS